MIVVVDEIKKVVERASKIYESDIYFYHDHIKAISEILIMKSQTKDSRETKYPCVMLLHDFAERYEKDMPYDLSCRLQLLIVSDGSKLSDTAEQRINSVYKQKLYPIYEALIKAFNKSPLLSLSTFSHDKIDRIRLQSALNEACLQQGIKALFSDVLDGIEIRNLDLKITQNC